MKHYVGLDVSMKKTFICIMDEKRKIVHESVVNTDPKALIDAIEKFDSSRGVKFETYCSHRIRGSILDYLREIDWVPRVTRNRNKQFEQLESTLEADLRRKPTDIELIKELLKKSILEKPLKYQEKKE